MILTLDLARVTSPFSNGKNLKTLFRSQKYIYVLCTSDNAGYICRSMNWRHTINVIKKTLVRNGFDSLADQVLMAEVNGGKNANATLKEVVSKLAEFKRSDQEAYGYIVTEAEGLKRFAKSYGIEPST
jgi:hypothetical protein